MPITKLNLDGAATQAELKRIADQHENAFGAEVTTEGVEAEISTTNNGWGIAAFVKRKWSGETSAGAKVRKTF